MEFFPFSAIVGQEEMKLALILNVIDPTISGVLIMGEKGTGKSSCVRALADLMPEFRAVKDCRFSCDPSDKSSLCSECREKIERGEKLEVCKKKMKVVELPLGATEDRLCGTLDIEVAIKEGKKRFEPGILAYANRNFLYVDEVNLLDDNLVDLLLDSAAMGRNIVEREGISFSHPARFVLVGTMNPEEGDLRPQLLDRFGLCVHVEGIKDVEMRKEIAKRRLSFERNKKAFCRVFTKENKRIAKKITSAKKRLKKVKPSPSLFDAICTLTSKLDLDGHRADIVLLKSALAFASYEEKDVADLSDLKKVAPFALYHRFKRKPFEDISFDQKIYDVFEILEGFRGV